LLEPESFNVYINAAAPIIVILGHSEVNLDTGMEIMESDSYKEVLGDDRDTNGVLAMM